MPFKVKIDGKEHEVSREDITELDDGYVLKTQTELNGIVQDAKAKQKSSLEKQFEAERGNVRSQLAKDDDFYKEMVKARGGDPDETDTARQQRLFADWEKEHLAPVRDEAAKLKETLADNRRQILVREIESAAREAGVKDEYLKNPLDPTMPGHIVQSLAATAEWDDESGKFVFKEGGTVIQAKGEVNSPAGVKEIVSRLKGNKEAGVYFTDARPGRVPVGDTRGGERRSDARVITGDEFLAMSNSERAELALSKDFREGRIEILNEVAA